MPAPTGVDPPQKYMPRKRIAADLRSLARGHTDLCVKVLLLAGVVSQAAARVTAASARRLWHTRRCRWRPSLREICPPTPLGFACSSCSPQRSPAMPSTTVRWWARTVLRYPPEFAVIVKIVGSSVGNRTDFHAHSDFNSLCRRTNSTAPAAPPRWGLFLGKSRPRPSPFRRYPQIMCAIALARHTRAAAGAMAVVF